MTRVNLSRLSPDKKRFLWQWIKENKPALADLLTDTQFKDAQEVFSAEVIVDLKASELEDVKKKFALVRPESV